MLSHYLSDIHHLHTACLAHTDDPGDGEKLSSAAYTAKCYSSHLMFALYIACQIRHASNIGNYMLQAGKLQCEVYLDANQTSGNAFKHPLTSGLEAGHRFFCHVNIFP